MKSELEEGFLFVVRAHGLPMPERQYKAVAGRRWAWDFAWPTERLLVEIDGGTWVQGRHTRGAGVEGDAEKQSTAAALGWRTMRLTGKLIDSGRAVELLRTALLATPLVDRRPLVRIEPRRALRGS